MRKTLTFIVFAVLGLVVACAYGQDETPVAGPLTDAIVKRFEARTQAIENNVAQRNKIFDGRLNEIVESMRATTERNRIFDGRLNEIVESMRDASAERRTLVLGFGEAATERKGLRDLIRAGDSERKGLRAIMAEAIEERQTARAEREGILQRLAEAKKERQTARAERQTARAEREGILRRLGKNIFWFCVSLAAGLLILASVCAFLYSRILRLV